MNGITYALCHKPVIGLVMFLTGLCAFPNLFEGLPVSLNNESNTAVKEFKVDVKEQYSVKLVFHYNAGLETLKAIDSFAGRGSNENCLTKYKTREEAFNAKREKRAVTPFEITLRRIEEQNAYEHFYVAGSCGVDSWGGGEIRKVLAKINLEKGKYSLSIRSLANNEIPNGVRTSILLSPPRSK